MQHLKLYAPLFKNEYKINVQATGVRRIKSTRYISPHPKLLPPEKELETCVDTYALREKEPYS
jgi:hypothetical protein